MQTQEILLQVPIQNFQAVKNILYALSETMKIEIKEPKKQRHDVVEKKLKNFDKYAGYLEGSVTDEEVDKYRAMRYAK